MSMLEIFASSNAVTAFPGFDSVWGFFQKGGVFMIPLLATSVASLWRPRRALLGLAPYALVVAAESLRCARRLEDPRDGVWLPASFAAMHTGWGLGVWSGALRLARGPRPARSAVSRSSAPRPGTPVPDPAR